jgi:phenylacetate-CoA ligase
MRLPGYALGDRSIGRLPRHDLRHLQSERLETMVAYVYRRAPFWRHKLDAAGVDPARVEGTNALSHLPTCTETELRADQEAHPPFGSYGCTPMSEWVKLFPTSGTADKPLWRVLSRRDWHRVLDWTQRLPPPCHSDVLVLTTPADSVMGAAAVAASHERAGALVVEMGTRTDRQKVEAIAELRPTRIAGSPSHLLHLAGVATALGIDLSISGVRMILSGLGEPGVAAEAINRLLLERFGAEVIVDVYGVAELFPFGVNCPFTSDLHLNEDLVLVESLRPDADQPVPPGELGELTYTNLVGDTQPLLRFRSGDLGVLADGSPCACGSTHVRIAGSIRGRVGGPITLPDQAGKGAGLLS